MSNNTVPTPANPAGWKFETRQIHAGQAPDAATGARALPIYQTTSFVFENAEQAANRFALAELGPIYTRLNNPTQEVIENRIASLEGGVGALLVASGQSAITYAILNIAGAGDHIVASPSIYGGTYNLLKYTLADLGVETTFVENPDDLQQWREAVRPNTKLFFGETVPNPRNDVLDIEPIAQIAHEAGVPLIVDNTVPTPYLVRPIEFGADVVIHSATKYLGGHGTFPIFSRREFRFCAISGRRFLRPTPSILVLGWRPFPCASNAISKTPPRSRTGWRNTRWLIE